MEIKKSWLVMYNNVLSHLVLTEQNYYYLGSTTNVFGYETIEKHTAEKLINQ